MSFELANPRFENNGIDSYYDPCRDGLHFCGFTDCDQPYTALNIVSKDGVSARQAYEQAKLVGSCSEAEGDYLVDLVIGDDVDEDFWTNRQLFIAIVEAIQ